MSWSHVVVEGFCSAEEDDKKLYPCGKPYPTTLCLVNHACPYFGWAKSNEREATHFVPLRLIVWDKVTIWWWDEFLPNVRWYFWYKWHEIETWGKPFEVLHPDDPLIVELDKEREEAGAKFIEWFEIARKEGL